MRTYLQDLHGHPCKGSDGEGLQAGVQPSPAHKHKGHASLAQICCQDTPCMTHARSHSWAACSPPPCLVQQHIQLLHSWRPYRLLPDSWSLCQQAHRNLPPYICGPLGLLLGRCRTHHDHTHLCPMKLWHEGELCLDGASAKGPPMHHVLQPTVQAKSEPGLIAQGFGAGRRRLYV